MPSKQSAGLLLYRFNPEGVAEVLLAHMGGPYWAHKAPAWSIPKGEHQPVEDPFQAACREFQEELGSPPPTQTYIPLGELRLPSGKRLTVWAGQADFATASQVSNTFDLEWPPHSGQFQAFPEVDAAAWFDFPTAKAQLLTGQLPFLERLSQHLASIEVESGRTPDNHKSL